ncbi:MAG: GAF domain-containing protein, partial [candidate division Zixibacteria bacterium]|nr:GAF domain-containing protein [candidate division Zixibacteria bacterium]
MPKYYVYYAYPVLVFVLALFFIYRLKIAQTKNTGGVGLIYSGLILTFLVSLFFLIEQHPDFPNWFLDGIYPIIVIFEFIFLAVGLVLFVAGLAIYFSHWGDRISEVDIHLSKLKLLENIQQECRAPYPVPELLNRVLSRLLYGLEENTGAAYLFNQENQTYTLAAVAGLSDNEIELLKDYQYGRNVISEAIDNDTPLITSDFRSFGGKAQLALIGFNSLLVLPLISGKTKLGVLLFLSEKKSNYSEETISILSPIINWLSNRIEITQIGRVLKRSELSSETTEIQITDQFKILRDLVNSISSGGSLIQFVKKCRTLAKADEAWLIGLANDELKFYGSSTDRIEFSDNFRAALVNALSKRKAVVLNQEGTDKSGQSSITRSSILYPVGKNNDAILLMRQNEAISISETDQKIFDIVASLTEIVIENSNLKNSVVSRLKGFDTINEIFRINLKSRQSEQDIIKLVNKATDLISAESIVLLFKRRDNHFEVVYSNIDNDSTQNIVVAMGEGGVGKIAALKHSEYESGFGNVSRYLEQYNQENRIQIRKLFGDSKGPVFQGDYPIL